MIASTMQDDYQLTVTSMLRHAEAVYPDSEVVTWQGGTARRACFADVAVNARRLADALEGLGVRRGERVATLCPNSQEHLETYLAVPCMGSVVHTVNPRLPSAQLAHVINHAEDRVLVVDASLLPALETVASQLTGVVACIVVGSDGDAPTSLPNGVSVHSYDRLLAAASGSYEWPELSEREPAAMCYSSGTTGDPKGVVYSHRSTYLHALATNTHAVTAARESDRMLVVVPMYHVNAWGVPYASLLSGSSLLMPGRYTSPVQLCDFAEAERASYIAAVPTVWAGILEVGRTRELDLSAVRMGTSGGAAIPRALLVAFEEQYGLRIMQGWGMTETSPVAGMARPPAGIPRGTDVEVDWRMNSGRVIAGVQMRVVAEDGTVLDRDGASVGEIEVAGPWVAASYYRDDDPERFRDGWLRTGDLGTLDSRGYFRITDRVKDVIKSGGEWISSVALENLLAASPEVAEAAVIGIPDPTWSERPLALVVPRGPEPDPASLAAFVAEQVPSWQVPENWAFVEQIPKTSVGKFDKKALRTGFAAGRFDLVRTRAPGERA